MFLKKFIIKNFRCIQDLTLDFNKGVNILIGENNAGKTTVIDAIRICLSYGKQWRDIYVSVSDFYVDKANPRESLEPIEFHLHFQVEKPVETGIYNDLLAQTDEGQQELQLHFRYHIDEKKGIQKVKYKVWGGELEGQPITPELLDLFYFVHLDALRDAVQYLRPVRGNRLGELYSKIETDDTKKEQMAARVRKTLDDDEEWSALIKSGKEKVNEHLMETSIDGKVQNVIIDFLPFEFRKIVDTLRILMPVYPGNLIKEGIEQRVFELYQNGLGYNNLIYTAIVLGDLKTKKELEEATYVALLIEEPEAHLHPQLQNTFFNYLNKLNEIGFQIFISSHSPTITAKAELDSLIVLQDQEHKIQSFLMKRSGLDENNKKYLQKFLDVTKSQLLFSNGVILVEGISEALLLPIFSRMIGEEYNIEKKGIELVNLNGIAFEHFAKLFNSDDPKSRLNCRCAILTDDDRDIEDNLSSRAKRAKDLEKNQLKVELAKKTFEYELFTAGNNKEILLEIFSSMHPLAACRIEQGSSTEEFATNFVDKVVSNKAKSELAHILALKLQNDPDIRNRFTVPGYIKRAIEWVVKGE
jgi:putative ATP-dependent endonuclease of OLD family